MIDEKELRLGNIVQAKIDVRQNETMQPVMYIVDSIKEKAGLSWYYKGYAYPNKTTHIRFANLEGVPLTEYELINRFGFECVDTNDNGGDHFYYLSETDFMLDRSFQHLETETELKYVHELQNWYYWKNNKTELTIKSSNTVD